jgi:hypothetical protein
MAKSVFSGFLGPAKLEGMDSGEWECLTAAPAQLAFNQNVATEGDPPN